MSKQRINDADFPFATLEKFGLTQAMIEDLPVNVLQTLYEGGRTPMLPISMVDKDGMTARSYARIAIVQTEDGRTDVLFYPKLQTNCLERENDADGGNAILESFSEEDKERLRAGQPVIGDMVTANGVKTRGFHQIDSATKQLLSVPTPIIGRNIQMLSEEFHLNSAEINCLQSGLPLTVVQEDCMMTMGIDLEAPTGLRLSNGDERKWREDNRRDYGKHSFGIFGCWTMNDDGTMDYTPEEEYSQDMWEEMKRKSNNMHR